MGKQVGIVGAGPAGLTAAMALQRDGARPIVFEAAEQVGGKCLTATVDGEQHELGAVIAAPGYSQVLALARELDVPLAPAPRLRLVDLAGTLDRQLHVPATGIAPARAMVRLGRVLAQYRRLLSPGFGDLPDELHQPIGRFLSARGLDAVRDAMVPAFTGYGYGYDDEIPAAYLLKMLGVGVPSGGAGLATWLRSVRATGESGALARYGEGVMFRDGYQSLWRAAAARCDVRTRCPVQRIARSGSRVRITAGGRDHDVDEVVLAVEPSVVLDILDVDDEERAAFSAVRHVDYYTVLCRVAPVPTGRALFVRDNARSDRRGKPVICVHTGADRRLCTVYVYGPGCDRPALTRAAIADRIGPDMRALGHPLVEVAHVRRWRYFPHLPPESIGWFYRTLERRQGHRRTWYLGEVMEFTTVESVVAHARATVRALC